MLRVVLADDNHLTLQQLNDIFAELSHLAIVVGQATDGTQALALIQQMVPDLAVLDIEMPALTGIEVARIVGRELPEVKILALSNYDNFDYLREMMKAGAEDYVLKHELSVSIIEAQLGRILNTQKQQVESSQREAYLSLVAKQSFLAALLHNNAIDPDYKSLMLTQDEFSAPLQALVVLQLTNYATLYQQLSHKQPGQLSQMILNLCGSVFMTIKNGVITPTNKGEFAVLFRLQPSISDTFSTRQLQEYTALIQVNLKRLLNVDCILESSLIHGGSQSLNQCYHMLSEKLGQRSFSSFSLSSANHLGMLHQHDLLNALEKGNILLCRQVLQDILAPSAHPPNVQERRETFNDLLSFCQQYFDNQQSREVSHSFQQLCVQLEAENGLRRLPQMVDAFLTSYLERRALENRQHLSAPVQKTLIYLQNHYKEDISLTTAAEDVGVSVVYLSKIFKAETGVSFVDHLTSLRIAKAKDLLEEQCLSIKDVCEQVGFRGSNYFIKVFGERIGKTPAQYRASIRKP